MDDPRDLPNEGGFAGPAGSTSPPQRVFPPPPSQPAPEPPQKPAERVELAPAPEVIDGSKFHYAGTDKNIDDPADANAADIEDALSDGPWEAAPQPFRKRDGFPDLTSESVSIRFDCDYYPADRERFQTPISGFTDDGAAVAEPRARAGELKALHSDEAIAVIEAGIGHREDPYLDEKTDAQRRRWKERDEDAERASEEARRRREDDDGA